MHATWTSFESSDKFLVTWWSNYVRSSDSDDLLFHADQYQYLIFVLPFGIKEWKLFVSFFKLHRITFLLLNKTVLLRDRKRRTTRAPPPKVSKMFVHFFVQNFVHFFVQTLSISCPKFCPTFLSKFIGGYPGGAPPVWAPPRAAPPQLGGYPRGRPPVGGYGGAPPGPPSWGGTPGGAPPPVGAPCEQTNWKHYLPVILRMRAVINTHILWKGVFPKRTEADSWEQG